MEGECSPEISFHEGESRPSAASPAALRRYLLCRGFSEAQGLTVSRDTLHELLGYLEDCFLVRLTWMDATSERQRLVNPRKVHPVDTGLIAVFDRSGKTNLGRALESAVRVELERRRADVRYVRKRDGFEVDFLARWPEGGESLIQIAADMSDPATRDRELRALLAAPRERPRASAGASLRQVPAAAESSDFLRRRGGRPELVVDSNGRMGMCISRGWTRRRRTLLRCGGRRYLPMYEASPREPASDFAESGTGPG